MAIGSWGSKIVFTVSDRKVLTFRDMTRTISADWATHSRIGLKDQVEYLRPALQKLTFTMELNALLGVRPRAMLDKLATCAEKGLVYPMVVGGRRVGKNRWRITNLSEAWETVLDRGELIQAKVTVTMEEYV